MHYRYSRPGRGRRLSFPRITSRARLCCQPAIWQGQGAAVPVLSYPTSSVLRVDADGGFAPFSAASARRKLVAAARRQGIAAMAITNSFHFSALRADLEPLGKEDPVALNFVVRGNVVALCGGTQRWFGTNPIRTATSTTRPKFPPAPSSRRTT